MRITILRMVIMVVTLAFSKAEAGYVIIGIGAESCGTWTKERAKGGLNSAQAGQWMLGYITAFNALGPRPSNFDHQEAFDIAEGINGDGIKAWIDNWCQAHPLDDINASAIALIQKLRKRKGY
jgi:hypothetical protein